MKNNNFNFGQFLAAGIVLVAVALSQSTAAAEMVQDKKAMQSLSADEMGQISAQGFDLQNFTPNLEEFKKNGFDISRSIQNIGKALGFGMDVSIKGLVLDVNMMVPTVNADGSVSLNVRNSIGEIAITNMRPGSNAGPSFGTVVISNISFNNTGITVSSIKN